MSDRQAQWSMPAAGSPQPNRPKAPKPAATKPLQVMQINRREEQEKLAREAAEARAAAEAAAEKARILEERAGLATPPRPVQQDSTSSPGTDDDALFDMGGMEGMTMADLLGPADQQPKRQSRPQQVEQQREPQRANRVVDDF
ncbi:MAG: 30S ribosomal protein S1, partial [Synechococcus sp.]